MSQYLIRRILLAVPLLLLISFLSFMITNLSPGDPVNMYINPRRKPPTAEEMNILRHQLGLDQPVIVRYVYWLGNIFTGNWGYSLRSHEQVTVEIFSRLPNTLLLGVVSFTITLLISIPVGVLSAVKRYSMLDYLTTFAAFVGISIPGFWFAMILIEVFSNQLGWLPSVGMMTIGENLSGAGTVWDIARHMVLPVLSLSITELAYWSRYQRATMVELMGQDFIRTARGKGLVERTVIWRHAFRNSLVTMSTLIGLSLPDLISGAYIIETIFGWPGMGRLGVQAILGRDYPVVMAVTMMSSVLVILGNLLADVLYVTVDPRIRQG